LAERKVPAVEQVGRILLYLAKSPRFKVKLTDIARDLGIHKSRVFYILNTLKEFGLIEKDPESKAYSLGPALIFMGEKVLDNLDFKDKAERTLKALAKETGCTAFLGRIAEDKVYVVAKEYADDGVKITIPLGYRFPSNYGALGKVLLAFSQDLKGTGAFSEEELEKCRRLGFAMDIREVDPRFSSVAAPVFDRYGKVVAIIFLVGTFNEEQAHQYGQKVAKAAKDFTKAIGGSL